MNNFLERYKVEVTAIGPLYIGSGQTLKKKEWLRNLFEKKVHVVDYEKFLAFLVKRNLVKSFEKFFIDDKRPLHIWMKENKINEKDYASFTRNTLDSSGVENMNNAHDIALFIKDAYGQPYVPGSSLKGALRNCILANELRNNPVNAREIANQIHNKDVIVKKSQKNFLSKESKNISMSCFNTCDFDKEKKENMVNDIMKGLRVSDSKPLPCSCLTICQKIDYSVSDKENSLPILRECIKPGTKIEFELVLDKTVFDYKIQDIEAAIESFLNDYNEMFLQYFVHEELYRDNVIYLGGGVGFASKTITNQLLLNEKDRVKLIGKLLDITTGEQKHSGNYKEGVSPHIVKLTEYDGSLVQMGPCRITFKAM